MTTAAHPEHCPGRGHAVAAAASPAELSFDRSITSPERSISMPHLLAISGSLRADSYNARLLAASADLLPSGASMSLFAGLKLIPPFDEDDEHKPTNVAVDRLRIAVRHADALLIATPEYNSSIPGQLKNALDWASRPYGKHVLLGKPVAVVGASTGVFGAAWAQAETRKVLTAVGADVLDAELPIPAAHEAFTASGALLDASLADRLAGLLSSLIAATSHRTAA
jgi:chromate reductase